MQQEETQIEFDSTQYIQKPKEKELKLSPKSLEKFTFTKRKSREKLADYFGRVLSVCASNKGITNMVKKAFSIYPQIKHSNVFFVYFVEISFMNFKKAFFLFYF